MRFADSHRRDRQEGEQKPLVVLPYVKGVTERVTSILTQHAEVVNKPGKNLRHVLVKPKDSRKMKENTELVYQYECSC